VTKVSILDAILGLSQAGGLGATMQQNKLGHEEFFADMAKMLTIKSAEPYASGPDGREGDPSAKY
jgi:hypothetical protein